MEVLSLHREMAGEEGERCRVRYALLEERCGRERCCLLYTSPSPRD